MPTLRSVALSLALLTLIALSPAAHAYGELRLNDDGPSLRPEATSLSIRIVDGLARTTLRQTFRSDREGPIAGAFVLTLPSDAAVRALAIEVGDRRTDARLLAFWSAWQIWRDGLGDTHGRRHGALAGDGTLTVGIESFSAEETTVVEVEWVQTLPLVDGRWSYSSARSSSSVRTGDLDVRIEIDSTLPLAYVWPTHGSIPFEHDSAHSIHAEWRADDKAWNPPITFRAEVDVTEPRLDLRRYRSQDGADHFVATLTTPRAVVPPPRTITFVLDCSLSMRGAAFELARAGVLDALDRLQDADRVGVVRCSSSVASAVAPVEPLNAEHRRRLVEFVQSSTAAGRTPLSPAVDAALAADAEGHVILLTDGQATLGREAHASVLAQRPARLHTVRIRPRGSEAPSLFLRAAGYDGWAVEVRTRSDVTAELERAIAAASPGPQAAMELTVDGVPPADLVPSRVRHLPPGGQVVWTGRLAEEGSVRFEGRGTLRGEAVRLAPHLATAPTAGADDMTRDDFALRRILHLERLLARRASLPHDAPLPAGEPPTRELRRRLAVLSLACGIQSMGTSFVALSSEKVDPLDHRLAEAYDDAGRRLAARRSDPSLADLDTPLGRGLVAISPRERVPRTYGFVGAAPAFGERALVGQDVLHDLTPPAVEAALAELLQGLALAQRGDGRWSDGPDAEDVGVTAEVLLALLGHGGDPRNGPYADQIAAGARFLQGSLESAGELDRDTGASSFRTDIAVAHAFADLYGLHGHRRWKRVAVPLVQQLAAHPSALRPFLEPDSTIDVDHVALLWALRTAGYADVGEIRFRRYDLPLARRRARSWIDAAVADSPTELDRQDVLRWTAALVLQLDAEDAYERRDVHTAVTLAIVGYCFARREEVDVRLLRVVATLAHRDGPLAERLWRRRLTELIERLPRTPDGRLRTSSNAEAAALARTLVAGRLYPSLSGRPHFREHPR